MNQCFLGPSYKGVNVQNLTTGLSNIRLENGICVGTDVEDGHKTKGLAYSLNYPSTKHGVKPDGMSVDYCDDGLCPVPHRPNHYPTFPAAYEAYTHSRK
jgi:hypothetical protein